MIKPSPPKTPVFAFLLKWMLSSTPLSAARNERFCKIQLLPGPISIGIMRPGKQEPNAIMPSPCAVQMFWNNASPEKALENILPMPPPEVDISMLGVIQTMAPLSVIMDSPSLRLHVTTGKAPPPISYCMTVSFPSGAEQRCPYFSS